MKQETRKIILENVRPRIKGTPDITINKCIDFYLPTEDLKFLDFYLNNKPPKAFMGVFAILIEFISTVVIDDIIQKRENEARVVLESALKVQKKSSYVLFFLILCIMLVCTAIILKAIV